ncbi:MAG: LysM peptidoglycan-binding domain-containing protein [Gammaproteobacteria bacterium]|nr:LysM peptidoglycan-binding domain-containing protein [Gammaproteobacteria bacterium]
MIRKRATAFLQRRSHRTGVLALGLALMVSGGIAAWDVRAQDKTVLRSDHPSRYIVQSGDTLWDISGRFLRDPWLWPRVWEVNPQIKNPHLIYPGDEVSLTYRNGRPIIKVRRRGRGGREVLSPQVRTSPLASAIPTIPIDRIHPFLERSRVETDDQYEKAPYVLSVGKEHLVGSPGTRIYVRSVPTDEHTAFVVYRKGKPYVNASGEVLGYELLHIANAALDVAGDPATLLLTEIRRAVLAGDRLYPVMNDEFDRNFMPTSPAPDLSGEIISVVEGVTQIGQYQTVVLNIGLADGVQAGHVFDVYQRGEAVDDEMAIVPVIERYPPIPPRETRIELDPEKQSFSQIFRDLDEIVNRIDRPISREIARVKQEFEPPPQVTLPDERAGTVMVFRPFERVSYALVMRASRAMHINDPVRPPE